MCRCVRLASLVNKLTHTHTHKHTHTHTHIQGYGYQHLISLQHLEKAGLIRQQEGKTFANIRRVLRLVSVVDELVCTFVYYLLSMGCHL